MCYITDPIKAKMEGLNIGEEQLKLKDRASVVISPKSTNKYSKHTLTVKQLLQHMKSQRCYTLTQ